MAALRLHVDHVLTAHSQSTLWDAHGIKTVRRTLADVAALGKIDSDGTLRIGDDVVSVVYFRAGCVRLGVGSPPRD